MGSRPKVIFCYIFSSASSHYDLKKYFFCARIINKFTWNSLPESVISASTTTSLRIS